MGAYLAICRIISLKGDRAFAMAPAAPMSRTAHPLSAARRRFLQLILGGALAASAGAIAGCSGTAGDPEPIWRGPSNEGSGNRGGENGPRGGRDGGGGRGGGGGGPGR
jgi:hypothetical protein